MDLISLTCEKRRITFRIRSSVIGSTDASSNVFIESFRISHPTFAMTPTRVRAGKRSRIGYPTLDPKRARRTSAVEAISEYQWEASAMRLGERKSFAFFASKREKRAIASMIAKRPKREE